MIDDQFEDIKCDRHFSFSYVKVENVCKKLSDLDSRKASGYDVIGSDVLCHPITWLINKSIQNFRFPDHLKSAEISPIFKKGKTHDKKDYRPVSILPCFSKIFGGILIDQMYNFMSPLLSPFLSRFKKGHNCQNVLLRLIDKFKSNSDDCGISGALLTDLAKAFDCLPSRLLVAKLNPYGFNSDLQIILSIVYKG